jgi:glycosyltransferase involved in cell wall biosynthesis
MYNPNGPAVFSGSLYGKRKQFLAHPALKDILFHPFFSDRLTIYPFIFDRLPAFVRGFSRLRVPYGITLNSYLYLLRMIRRRLFVEYLKDLKKYSATVNLPSLFKGYAGRVVESMAVGSPVISWRVPDRPRTTALFEDDKEILLFDGDSPEQLARQIMRVKAEPGLANRLIENARQKVLRLHTMEIRVKQILDWIETGNEPRYD